jgi:hypothetical protein
MTKSVPPKQSEVPASVADSGKIRIGAGWGLLAPAGK